MGDSGEGLVDADARIQERIEERESERKRRGAAQPAANPDKVRELESLRLAKAELERQAAATAHPVRKQQIQAAIAEIDKRLAAGVVAPRRPGSIGTRRPLQACRGADQIRERLW